MSSTLSPLPDPAQSSSALNSTSHRGVRTLPASSAVTGRSWRSGQHRRAASSSGTTHRFYLRLQVSLPPRSTSSSGWPAVEKFGLDTASTAWGARAHARAGLHREHCVNDLLFQVDSGTCRSSPLILANHPALERLADFCGCPSSTDHQGEGEGRVRAAGPRGRRRHASAGRAGPLHADPLPGCARARRALHQHPSLVPPGFKGPTRTGRPATRGVKQSARRPFRA